MPLSRDEANALMAALKVAAPAADAARLKSAVAPFVQTTVGQAVAGATAKPAAAFDPNDPVVKVMPRGWKGEDLRGKRFSECPPLFLGQLSHMLDGFADKNEADPERQRYARWDRENAIKAREWRTKLEGKASPQIVLPSVESLADEGVL